MMTDPIVLSPPQSEPIRLEDARRWLRIDVPGYEGDHSQDPDIKAWITGARQWAEKEIDHSIGVQQLLVATDTFQTSWGQHLTLPRGPVHQIDEIEYTAVDGTDVVLDTSIYRLGKFADPQLVILRHGKAWPRARCEPDSVRITYTAGYGMPDDSDGTEKVGQDVLQAMRWMIGQFYLHREATIVGTIGAIELPLGVRALLGPSRASIGV